MRNNKLIKKFTWIISWLKGDVPKFIWEYKIIYIITKLEKNMNIFKSENLSILLIELKDAYLLHVIQI